MDDAKLTLVVDQTPLVLVSVLDDADHVLGRPLLAQIEPEPIPQPLDRRLALERR
jgi:hypothetical protein